MTEALYDLNQVRAIIDLALREDIADGDITSSYVIPAETMATLYFTAREQMVVCGVDVVRMVFTAVDEKVLVETIRPDGEKVSNNAQLIKVSGSARSLLTGERTALNFMQRMSGVATMTAQYVEAVKGTGAKILDTRKTMPGMRALDKYAVKIGGGENHRYGLFDMVLIKDNHIAIAGGLSKAVASGKWQVASDSANCELRTANLKIEVEVDNLEQFSEALKTDADIIMLDNFSLLELKDAVKMNDKKKILEASGGVSLDTVRSIAETGVDFISVGRLTHSAPAVDIGLDYVY